MRRGPRSRRCNSIVLELLTLFFAWMVSFFFAVYIGGRCRVMPGSLWLAETPPRPRPAWCGTAPPGLLFSEVAQG